MIEFVKEKYDVIKKIGQGGMAEIFLVKNRQNNKKYAIKFLQSTHRDNQKSWIKRFKAEMELTKKVKSPYVVKIIDTIWNEKVQYFVMEYIDGEILKNYIKRRSRLNVDEVVEFSKQLSLGLKEIHNLGIIHRDIKSTNVIVTSHGQIKIIDFGIAITKESTRLTQTNNIIGSVHYIAPEILDKKIPNKRSDIYSLGILMYEMLVGSVPFQDSNSLAVALKHKKSNVPWVNKYFDNIPQSLANVVAKCTIKNPYYRYKNMEEFYEDISTVFSKERRLEEKYVFAKNKIKSFKEIINSHWTLVFIIGLLFLGCAIFVVFLLVHGIYSQWKF